MRPITVGVAALCAVLMVCSGRAAAQAPCAGADMYVAAHQDDTILFQSPDLLRDIRSNRCVRTVFTTAGDAGHLAHYSEQREIGAEAAYAEMAGVANIWLGSTLSLAGHPVRMETLAAQPGISILFMRLPDGGIDGEGFPLYGEQSLLKLWNGAHGEDPEIDEIEADDESTSYEYDELVAALTAAIQSFGAHHIVTQNYAQSLPGPDHPDHVITGRLVLDAAERLPASFGGWRLTPYEDYEVTFRPPNLGGPLLAAKEAAFAAYIPFDEECQAGGGEECESGVYPEWLERQYVETDAVETAGAVADAGLEQSAGAGAPVSLDGAASGAEGGGPLGYSWSQVGGPAVTLSGANTVSPSLTTPPHPTLLTFALTVNRGVITSAPDFVRVRVPGASPDPTAVAGPDQSAGAGARVTLDGSASWDPESLPLAYRWTQTAGPPVMLSDATAATPGFTAPVGPATTLAFSLVVSNGSQASAAATVRIAVAAAPPPGGQDGRHDDGDRDHRPASSALSRGRVKLTAGKKARQVVLVAGAPASSCHGRLPVGALCRVSAVGNVVVEARRSLRRSGTFHLTVSFGSDAEPAKRPLIVVINRAKTKNSAQKIK